MEEVVEFYDADYFERGEELGKSLYTNYQWLPEVTIPFCAKIIEFLGIRENETILDLGCAKGFLVKGFRLLHRQAWGIDISEYAISCTPKDIKPYVNLIRSSEELREYYDWVIAKDVFEHISYSQINNLLDNLRIVAKKIFAIIPLGDGKKYVIPDMERDITHIIREDIDWWIRQFESSGFKAVYRSYKVRNIKEKWTAWGKGNGFFILR